MFECTAVLYYWRITENRTTNSESTVTALLIHVSVVISETQKHVF